MADQRNAQTCLDVLQKTAQTLSGLLNEPEIVEILLGQAVSVLSAQKALLLLRSPERDRLLLAGAFGLSETYLAKVPLRVSESPVNRRALDGELITIGDITCEPDFQSTATEEGLCGLVAAPLMVRDNVIGVLHVYMDTGSFQESENMALLRTLAGLGGLALERARLYQSLYHIAQVLNSSLDLKTILQGVLEATVNEMWLKAASIRLLDPKSRILKLVAAYGLTRAYLEKGEVHVEKSEIDRRLLKGETVILHDVEHDPGYEYPMEAAKEGILSVLAVPLKLEDRILGVMRVYSSEPRHFNTVAINFLKSAADLVSLAIENARLHAALEARYKDLKVDVAEWHRFLALG